MSDFQQNTEKATPLPFKRALWILVAASVTWALFEYIHVFQQIERLTFDQRFRSRAPIEQSSRIGAIDVDETTIQRVGSWPLVRTAYADVLHVLDRCDAEVLSFDIFFPEQGPLNVSADDLSELQLMLSKENTASAAESVRAFARHPDQVFADSLAESGLGIMGMTLALLPHDGSNQEAERRTDTFLGGLDEQGLKAVQVAEEKAVSADRPLPAWVPDSVGIVAPQALFTTASIGMGMAQITLDLDGTVRQYPTVAAFDQKLYFSSALVTYCSLIQADINDIILHHDYVELPPGSYQDGTEVEALRLPVDNQGRLLVNWAGRYTDTFLHIPAHALLSMEAESLAKKRISMHGSNLAGLTDSIIKGIKREITRRRLIPASEADALVDNILIAEFAEQAEALGVETRTAFAEAFGGDDPATTKAAGDIYDQVTWCHAILTILTDSHPDNISYPMLKEQLKIPDEMDDAMTHSLDYLTFIAHQQKNPQHWSPLYFPTRQSIKDGNETHALSPWSLYNRAFYIGLTAVASHDMKPMPFEGQYPMVGLHQNVLNSLITRSQLSPLSPVAGWLLTALLAFAPSLLIARLRPIASGLCSLALCGLWIMAATTAFSVSGVWIPIAAPLTSLIAVYLVLVVTHYVQEQTEKKLMHHAFSTYMTPAVVEEVLKTPDMLKLGGQDKDLSVFFADLENFTTFTESCEAQELVQLINEYLDGMTEIIFRHGGTLDKFEGDGIMAFWGAPVSQDDHATRACLAALDGQAWIKETLHPKWLAAGRPAIRARIGVSSGLMVVGNMGSNSRMDYTVMGDNVNLGARLESANKFFGTHIMVSAETYDRVKDVVACRELDTLRVIGRKRPVVVYELITRHEELNDDQATMIELFSASLALYRERKWEQACTRFEELVDRYPKDGPSLTYVMRCKDYLKHPPGDSWDGIWSAPDK